MPSTRPRHLGIAVDEARDHVLGGPKPDFTLLEYGSYACEHCHAAHEVVTRLRERFGDRMRYVYRHLPLTDRVMATRAAELAEYASETRDGFWEAHDALMRREPSLDEAELEAVAAELGLPLAAEREGVAAQAAEARVREDARSGLHSGARITPTFFINGRRYEGAWDETALAEALLRTLGHRIYTASVDFARWAPSSGLLLLVGTVLAILLSNSAAGPAFGALWRTPLGIQLGERAFALSLVEWVNHGLLSVFFLVVGLEIKRELTIGRLASRRAAGLPIAGALGGMTVPTLIYLAVVPSGPLAAGWGVTIATDTAFAIAIIVLLGDRVPVDLRVFLTAAVIVDDLVAIAIVALFYAEALSVAFLGVAILVTALLVAMNRSHVYRHLPYAALGLVLWFALHEAGVHATLAGVILAVVTPTRPPPNLRALTAQAQTILRADQAQRGASAGWRPSEAALRALDTIHGRIESPASKLLRAATPWSSYFVLPVFALANAGLVWTPGILEGRGRLVLAIVGGLVLGKPVGILLASWLSVKAGIAQKPGTYGWRQLAGAGALAGIGFTMSLFIAQLAFAHTTDFTAAKVAIFIASSIAGVLGTLILWPRTTVRASSGSDAERSRVE